MTDLLELTAELVSIPSISRDERAITDHLEAMLRPVPWLTLDRVGENLVARTQLGRDQRLLLGGHTDTVPGSQPWRVDGDTLWGLGAADMKGGVAVLAELARTVPEPVVDVTYVFYECEEIEARFNGLKRLFEEAPALLAADAAVLAEPTASKIEAGCQGTMRVCVTLRGERAHTARPWMGRNAIHRAGRLLALVERFEERRPVLDGCEYREALQAVQVGGGVAGNVVPDVATVTLNHRFAPDRDGTAAEASLRRFLAPVLEEGDELEVIDVAPSAAPGLEHPLLRTLIDRNHLEVRSKLGWTDVARFAAAGIPAANFGPGDPLVAHTQDEHVTAAQLDRCYAALADLLTSPPR